MLRTLLASLWWGQRGRDHWCGYLPPDLLPCWLWGWQCWIDGIDLALNLSSCVFTFWVIIRSSCFVSTLVKRNMWMYVILAVYPAHCDSNFTLLFFPESTWVRSLRCWIIMEEIHGAFSATYSSLQLIKERHGLHKYSHKNQGHNNTLITILIHTRYNETHSHTDTHTHTQTHTHTYTCSW